MKPDPVSASFERAFRCAGKQISAEATPAMRGQDAEPLNLDTPSHSGEFEATNVLLRHGGDPE
jgi:hypothetical protein